MEHPILFLTLLFEAIGLGDFAHSYPHVLYSWLILIFLLVVARLSTLSIKMIPGRAQNFFEVLVDAIENFQVEIMGEEGRQYFPLVASLFMYILLCNYLGMIPGMLSPTANINTTLSCALVAFSATHYVGIRHHGIKYVKHFLGPMPALIPLMLPLEIIGHSSRVLSLTLRLFGNVMGEDLVLAILLFLAGKFLVPTPMMFLFLFFSAVQAFIFMLLTMMYITAAIEESHMGEAH
ncbi:MAG: F0F1 ATP synthase subunit A [Deltaproteobacteria bacterium]|nr:F0F1 ATP synthase subunit A [Deltaproteobacteria bacterium]